MRLGLVAAKPTDAVTYGLLPGDEPPAGLPYPVALKPAGGWPARTSRSWARQASWPSGARSSSAAARGEMLVAEEYLPGTLRTLETLGDGETTWVLGGFLTTMSALPWFVEERLTWDPLPPGEELDHVRRALSDLGVSFGACRTPGTSHTTGSSCIHPLRSIA